MIEKLVKEFEKIYASLGKSKKLILADIDKIDEKYRKLAQEEKKSLTESLSVLNEQMKYYANMLGGKVEDVKDEAPTEEKTDEEPVIEDTIFPENNETNEVEETKTEEEPAPVPADDNVSTDSVDSDWTDGSVQEESKGITKDEIVEKLENAGFKDIETVVKEEEEQPAVFETNDDGWPIPDDWK